MDVASSSPLVPIASSRHHIIYPLQLCTKARWLRYPVHLTDCRPMGRRLRVADRRRRLGREHVRSQLGHTGTRERETIVWTMYDTIHHPGRGSTGPELRGSEFSRLTANCRCHTGNAGRSCVQLPERCQCLREITKSLSWMRRLSTVGSGYPHASARLARSRPFSYLQSM